MNAERLWVVGQTVTMITAIGVMIEYSFFAGMAYALLVGILVDIRHELTHLNAK